MKKIHFLAFSIFISFFGGNAFGQMAKAFVLMPACKQTISTTDSAQIFARLTASDGFSGITWKQTAGPALISLPPALTIWSTSLQANSIFTVRNLAAGTYVFQATGTSLSGITGSVIDTLQVNIAPRRIAYTVTVYNDSTRVITQ